MLRITILNLVLLVLRTRYALLGRYIHIYIYIHPSLHTILNLDVKWDRASCVQTGLYLIWINPEFELYCAFESLTERKVAMQIAHDIRQWVRANDQDIWVPIMSTS